MKITMTKKTLLFISAIILLFIPLIFYIITFRTHSISQNPSDWGAFGDYIGGVLSLLLSIYTTGLLIYITILLNKKDSKEAQIRKNKDIKYKIYFEIIKTLRDYSIWECSKAKCLIEYAFIKQRYEDLTNAEKKALAEKHNKEKREILERCIIENISILKSTYIYINDLPLIYKQYFPTAFETSQYVSLKEDFSSFINNFEQLYSLDSHTIETIKDETLRQNIDRFLELLYNEVNRQEEI